MKKLLGVLAAVAVITASFFFLAHPSDTNAATANGSTLNTHAVMVDSNNKLVSWVTNQDQAYDTVVRLAWDYLFNRVPNEPGTGQPAYLSESYLNPDTQQLAGWPSNPAGMFSMLIESAMSYYQYSGDTTVLVFAQRLADQQLANGMTLPTDDWANVPYASGDAGSLTYHGAAYGNSTGVGDGVGIIEPDKVGEFGFALIKLYEQTGNTAYRDAAIKDADALASHVRAGNASQSPWPFRVNAQTGAIREEYSAHVISAIELFDELIRLNFGNVAAYQTARTTAWNWMMTYPMVNNVWSGYFEDVAIQTDTSNANQLNAMMVARYLLRNPQTDSNWQAHVRGLISWVESNFGVTQFGATTIQEQYAFPHAMGSHTSRYASVNALLYEKTGDLTAKEKAYRSFNWATYMARSTGVVIDGPTVNNQWFTDGYGDYIRHFMVGMGASPDWAPNGQTHLLESSSVVQNIAYTTSQITYTTFDASSTEEIKVANAPTSVTVGGIVLAQRTDLAAEGWTYDATQNVMHIRHDNGTSVVIALNGVPANQLPTVALVSPANNATSTPPATFVLQANASDPDGTVSRVEFYSNGALMATATTSPYTYTLTSLPAGAYSLFARAYDDQNASSNSNTAVVTVGSAVPSAAPTLISEYETPWNTSTTPKTTVTFSVQAGDVLVASALSEDAGITASISGGSLTWTQRQVVSASGYGWVSIWTATVDTSKTMSVTFARVGGAGDYGGNVYQFRNASIGTSSQANAANSAPTLNLTTTQANSAIVVASVDWTALSGASRVWRTSAGPFTEKSYANVSGAYTIYSGFHPNAGAIGTYALGLTVPAGQKFAIAALEVKGTGSGADTTPPVISGVTTGSINQNGASIMWTTDEPATSRVEYGLTASYGDTTAVNTSLDTAHTQVVAGLNAGTLYHYRIHSIDAAGNEGVSPDFTFTTPAPVDTTVPSVPANVTGTAVSSSQINVNWTASTDNVGVTGYKIYRDGAQISTSGTNWFSDTGLLPNTTFSYAISAFDAAGNESAQSGSVSATTQPPPAGPTLINEYETPWNTSATPKTTATFSVEAGDVLVASALSEDVRTTASISGGSLTWTQRQVVSASGYGWVSIWTATVDTAKTMSVTFTRAGGARDYGGNVHQFRNSAGIGASSKANAANGAPTLNLTTTHANSAIVVASVDWTALSGASRVWRTSAGPFTERSYAAVSGAYTIYSGFHPNAGAIGTYALGLSVPAGQKYSIVAVEVK